MHLMSPHDNIPSRRPHSSNFTMRQPRSLQPRRNKAVPFVWLFSDIISIESSVSPEANEDFLPIPSFSYQTKSHSINTGATQTSSSMNKLARILTDKDCKASFTLGLKIISIVTEMELKG